jgi:hypothetical protein
MKVKRVSECTEPTPIEVVAEEVRPLDQHAKNDGFHHKLQNYLKEKLSIWPGWCLHQFFPVHEIIAENL